MFNLSRAAQWGVVLVLGLAVLYLGFVPEQSEFPKIALGFGPAFLGYACLLSQRRVAWQQLLVVAVVLRVLLVFAPPLLSDDVYRFVWDGRLILAGVNPFEYLPRAYVDGTLPAVPGLTAELFARLNSPDYFTIYPPLAQAVFTFAVWCFPDDVLAAGRVMKGVLLLAELSTLWFLVQILRQLRLPPRRVLLYALNPLVLIEIMGNLHFEGLMVSFLAAALYGVLRGGLAGSAAALALSVGSKLLPLMFLPLLLRRLPWRAWLRYYLVAGAVILLLFVPLLSGGFLEGFGSSLDLYFRKFEFNASIYYILRWIGYLQVGWNKIATIGPWMGVVSLMGILAYTFLERRPSVPNLARGMLFVIGLYLLFALTVHPWYCILPVFLCTMTRFRFPLLWSGLIWLTYVNYNGGTYAEHLWVVGIEYGLVFGYLVWELWRRGADPATTKAGSHFSQTRGNTPTAGRIG